MNLFQFESDAAMHSGITLTQPVVGCSYEPLAIYLYWKILLQLLGHLVFHTLNKQTEH